MFQHTAARRRLDEHSVQNELRVKVSTHSRPKAAGSPSAGTVSTMRSFNTQPPEGGWTNQVQIGLIALSFNTQPPEGGWVRPSHCPLSRSGCFNTQPPEGGWYTSDDLQHVNTCFNTQPPEGGWAVSAHYMSWTILFQHTAARRRLDFVAVFLAMTQRFQHTAARRRLEPSA